VYVCGCGWVCVGGWVSVLSVCVCVCMYLYEKSQERL